MKKLSSIILCFCAMFCTCVHVMPAKEAQAAINAVEGYYDTHVIPDSYNTGVDESADFTTVSTTESTFLQGVQFRTSNDDAVTLNFSVSGATEYPAEVTFENVDFSNASTFRFRSESNIERTYTFINCKFPPIINEEFVDVASRKLNLVFINCNIQKFSGGNATFRKCKFTGGTGDIASIRYNTVVEDCFFGGFPQTYAESTKINAIRINGKADIPATDITVRNCRIEMPAIKGIADSYLVSAIAVSMTYSSAENVLFEDVYVNGGGYTTIINTKNDWTFNNVVFRNITTGSGYMSGTMHPTQSGNPTLENIKEATKLYVSSVFKDDLGKTHLIVSNDTAVDKELVVVTDKGTETFPVKCQKTLVDDGAVTTEELPYDIDIVLEASDIEHVICYDTTEDVSNQIRFVNWGDSGTSEPEIVTEGYYDTHVIPDSYNTGADESVEFTVLADNSSVTLEGVNFTASADNVLICNFSYGAKDAPTEVTFENYDFTGLSKLHFGGTCSIERTYTFINCKFSNFATPICELEEERNFKAVFKNCNIVQFQGADATFDKCKFGGSYSDSLNPFYNVTVTNSFFGNYAQNNTDGIHTDAIQIYGRENIPAENITIQNCRIEIPAIEGISDGCINAPIMIQLEYANANGILFEDCIINGGGYSIYAWDKNKGLTLENVVLRNIQIGKGYRFNKVYPTVSEGVTFENLTDTEKLYVTSVWKDTTGKTHLAVSNDTDTDRELVVRTSKGLETFTIKCKNTLVAEGATTTEELPFDIDLTLDGDDLGYVVCYDTEETAASQIRFMNWSGSPVYRGVSSGSGSVDSGNEGSAEGNTDIYFSVVPTVVDITVPLNVACYIDPNEEEGFTHGDLNIVNNSYAPVNLYLGYFKASDTGKTMTTPDGLSDGLTWETLTKTQSQLLFAIGVRPQTADGWKTISTDEFCYVDNMAGRALFGTILPNGTVALEFNAYHGRSFSETQMFPLSMGFIVELYTE